MFKILFFIICAFNFHSSLQSYIPKNCSRLSNGCRFKFYTNNYEQDTARDKVKDHILICKSLEQSSSVNESIRKCPGPYLWLYFRLSGRAILDKSFDAIRVFSIPNLQNVQFRFLKGFDVDSYPQNHIYPSRFVIQVFFSQFSFYLNKSLVKSCDQLNGHTRSILRVSNTLYVPYVFANTKFGPHPTCPLLFTDSKISKLAIFNSLVNSFHKKNILRFSTDQTQPNSINSHVQNLVLVKFDKIDLDETLLERRVFENVMTIVLIGEIASIQLGLFKSFRDLRTLTLHGLFYPKLARQRGLAWMRDLNSHVRVNFSDRFQLSTGILVEQVFIFDLTTATAWYGMAYDPVNVRIGYMLPDEDFCLYAEFPFEQAVLFYSQRAVINAERPCTFVWLNRYAQVYFPYLSFYRLFGYNFYAYFYARILPNLNQMIKDCNFEKK